MTRDDRPDDELMTRLGAVLHAEADALEPSSDSLARIQSRMPAPAGRTAWRWVGPLAAAAVVVGVAVGVVLFQDGDDDATPLPLASVTPTPSVPAPTPTPTSSPSPEPSPTCADLGTYVPVPSYFVGTSEGQSALYRQFFDFVRCSSASLPGAEAVSQAVWNMGSTQTAYQSLWPVGTAMTSFEQSGDTASITVSAAPNGDRDLALQQLVYTVTAADNTIASVTVTTPDGVYADVTRAPQVDVLAPVWLTGVAPSSVAGGHRIAMTGTASVFEAVVSWMITDEAGKVVDSGNARTPAAAPARGPWKATSKVLPDGHQYTVTAYVASAKDGSVTWPDSKKVP